MECGLGQMVFLLACLVGLMMQTGAESVSNKVQGFAKKEAPVLAALPPQRDLVTDFISNNVIPDNIRANLRYLSSKPHLAGTETDHETAQWVADTWRSYGLDDVNMADYQVLLSYPDSQAPNIVQLLDSSSGDVLAESSPRQRPLYAPEESMEEVPFNFNAYAAPGTVKGSVVYVNYGREQDHQRLEEEGVSCSGRVVLARYGDIFRGNIVQSAEGRGAIAVLLYTDPTDYALWGPDEVYPSNIMMPPSGAQLGTVMMMDGDPLTPFYPSIESAYHIPEDEALIPKIPVQPLSYEDAYFILNSLSGPEAPAEWQGGLNVTYRLGPTSNEYDVRVEVHTSNVPATIRNVIGVLRGSEEPDRYVMLGNHRDAWIFGAIDPSSGTAALVELTRVIMQLHNETGWRPRRSLVFCSWAAEEYGLVGSMEFTEQYAKQLHDRAVAYLNVDLVMEGNYTLAVNSVPLLYDVIWNASKLVGNPDDAEVAAGRLTLYDTWLLRSPGQTNDTQPRVNMLGSSSDYKGFLHNTGIPCVSFSYDHDENMTGGYPLYHTLYETFALVDEIYDPGFHFHSAVSQMWAQMAVALADAQMLPFSLNRYTDFILNQQFQINHDFGTLLQTNNRSFDHFLQAGSMFATAVETFQENLLLVDFQNPLAVRRINDQMMLVERAFIDPQGLPNMPEYNHVVFSPSTVDRYTGTAFSGLTDVLVALEEGGEPQQQLWRTLDQHLAAVTHFIQTAAKVLDDKLW